MEQIGYDLCTLCMGQGKITNDACPVCEGFGYVEFVVDENSRALNALRGEEADETSKQICNRRLRDSKLNPDNIRITLLDLACGFRPGTDAEQAAFEALNDAGARRWGWTWTNANRFAVELAKLSGIPPAEHRYALTKLAYKWLHEETPYS
jgi:hypothetical protein